jgi:hypothetical protein
MRALPPYTSQGTLKKFKEKSVEAGFQPAGDAASLPQFVW